MNQLNKKFKRVVILDTVIFYPEHRALLNSISEEVLEYPTSLPEGLEKQYDENPELFLNKKCYTHIAIDDTPKQLLMNRVDGADVIISCWTDIPDEILRLNPQLKLIIFWTHEKEHRINMKLAREMGITVANVPDYGTDAVAEVVFAGLWQLIQRNYGVKEVADNGDRIAHAVVDCVFNHFRLLKNNEKNTRAGKFTHHFHKIGEAKFDFTRRNIDELIPERLVGHKRVGLLNIANSDKAARMLEILGVSCGQYFVADPSLAEYYKFLSENTLIICDSDNIEQRELIKISMMFGDKIVDLKHLPTAEYQFSDKIFGIVGLGRIGKKVARIAKGIGFNVVYHSKTRNTELEEQLGVTHVELDVLAETSDVVSMHLPAHKAENLFNARLIAKMKKGSFLINTADGNAIDQAALTNRMLAGEVFAFLDVYPGLPRKDVLGMSMTDKKDWKIRQELSRHVLAYRAGWKTQESISVKTYKLLGEMIDFLIGKRDTYTLSEEM